MAIIGHQSGIGGSWTTVRQVAYTYYNGTESYGDAGDLKLAVVEDGSGNVRTSSGSQYLGPHESQRPCRRRPIPVRPPVPLKPAA